MFEPQTARSKDRSGSGRNHRGKLIEQSLLTPKSLRFCHGCTFALLSSWTLSLDRLAGGDKVMICLVLYLLLANYAAEGYTAGQVSRARAFARPTAHGDVLMATAVAIDALDLAALLCSRVCHDLISPTGAIVNGLEVLEEEDNDEETKTFALDLIKKSARTASARLQFCRLAFGPAGSNAPQNALGGARGVVQR